MIDIYVNKKYYLFIEKIFDGREYFVFKHPSIEDYVCYVPSDYVLVMGNDMFFKICVWEKFEFVYERFPKIPGKRFKKEKIIASDVKKIYEVDPFNDLNVCIVKYSTYEKTIFIEENYGVFIKLGKWLYSLFDFERKRVNAKHTEIITEKITQEEIYKFLRQEELNSLCLTLKVDYLNRIKSWLIDCIYKSNKSLEICKEECDFYSLLEELKNSLSNSMELTNKVLEAVNNAMYSFEKIIHDYRYKSIVGISRSV